jgi:hypothetical protein
MAQTFFALAMLSDTHKLQPVGQKEHDMNEDAVLVGELFFLLHPGEVEFSGYGLTVEAGNIQRLVGMLLVDRPQRVSRTWLAKIERTYGRYELRPMTKTGERGIACQMWITEDSVAHVRRLDGAFTRTLQAALFPLLLVRPKPQLLVSWDAKTRVWRSEFYQPAAEQKRVEQSRAMSRPRFVLGQVVATPGALEALEEAGHLPQEFLHRHMACDWGEVDPHDWQMNEQAVRYGGRLLSAYRTKKGVKIWIITESDRSVTTLLLPSEY